MNIFFLSYDPDESARFNVDDHVKKIRVEVCQICTTAHPRGVSPYKHTHVNHPHCVWVRQSIQNYRLAIQYGKALCKEFTHRYGKRGLSEDVADWLIRNEPKLPDIGLTRIPRCFSNLKGIIPETECIVTDYREYYKQGKRHLFNWKNRDIPSWIS